MRMKWSVLILAAAILVLVGCNKDKERVKTTKSATNSVNKESKKPEAAPSKADAKVEKVEVPKVDPCAHAAAFTGQWQLTTVVRGESKSAIGVNGYYSLGLTASACNVSGQLTKLGYSRVTFKPNKRQQGTLSFIAVAGQGGSTGSAGLSIARSNGKSVVHVHLFMTVTGETMNGYWLYTGTSFTKAPFWGSFKAIRDKGQRAIHNTTDYAGAEPAAFTQMLNSQRGSSKTAAGPSNRRGGRGLSGGSAAKMVKIMARSGIQSDSGMGRERYSAKISCHRFSGEGTYCTAGNKNMKSAKTVFKYLRKLGAREYPIDGRREGSEIDGTVECESSMQNSRDAMCCLGNGCISS